MKYSLSNHYQCLYYNIMVKSEKKANQRTPQLSPHIVGNIKGKNVSKLTLRKNTTTKNRKNNGCE